MGISYRGVKYAIILNQFHQTNLLIKLFIKNICLSSTLSTLILVVMVTFSLNRLYLQPPFYCRSGEIGRHARFRGVCPKGRVGSSPTFGTSSLSDQRHHLFFYPAFFSALSVFEFVDISTSGNILTRIVVFSVPAFVWIIGFE